MNKAYQIHNQSSVYFLTFQVVGWVDVFSRQCYRDLIIDNLDYCRNNKGLNLHAYVIMTNHIHLVVSHRNKDLSGWVRDFKKHIAKEVFKMIDEVNESRREWMRIVFSHHGKYSPRNVLKQFWTQENHAVELYNNDLMDTRVNYIHQNPVRAGWVQNAEDYLYSSARNFAKLDTLIDIDEL